jgi:hypothetical protein
VSVQRFNPWGTVEIPNWPRATFFSHEIRTQFITQMLRGKPPIWSESWHRPRKRMACPKLSRHGQPAMASCNRTSTRIDRRSACFRRGWDCRGLAARWAREARDARPRPVGNNTDSGLISYPTLYLSHDQIEARRSDAPNA